MKFNCEKANHSFMGDIDYSVKTDLVDCEAIVNPEMTEVEIIPIDFPEHCKIKMSYSEYIKCLVLDFISHFTQLDKHGEVTDTFTGGCCYWFADILCQRFPHGEIMYNQIENHFATKICDRVYDITGELQNTENMIPWDDFSDDVEKVRIVKQCIDFYE